MRDIRNIVICFSVLFNSNSRRLYTLCAVYRCTPCTQCKSAEMQRHSPLSSSLQCILQEYTQQSWRPLPRHHENTGLWCRSRNRIASYIVVYSASSLTCRQNLYCEYIYESFCHHAHAITVILLLFCLGRQNAAPDPTSYVVSIVEYSPYSPSNTVDNVEQNLRAMQLLVEAAAKNGTQIVVFPEYGVIGFPYSN